MIARKNKKQLAMEDYLDFIDNRTLKLNVSQLRQSILIDIVTTMELMDLRRSTVLNDDVSGDACFTLEEVINDLKRLNWQECHVTSLLTQGGVVSASATTTIDKTLSEVLKRPKKLKRKKVEVGVDPSVTSIDTTVAVAAGSTTVAQHEEAEAQIPDRLDVEENSMRSRSHIGL
ncbi:hypothetical protein BUALT_Bualt02G0047200 [Buddleja alternifolia]|uniref:Uncharacterized protein n=1 Tax=Buddleja alternifolia TaxID=168488 RepID=A0AAV6Y3W7_9LAMI|nr:hypothetical protein BUALT_Bualt02G0047200 [Buddleja alternifolia]